MGGNKKGKTFSLRNYLAIILPFIALMIVPFGCAHRPEVKVPPLKFTEAKVLPKFTEAELGRIAVVSACFERELQLTVKLMTKGKAAATGAWKGFVNSILWAPRKDPGMAEAYCYAATWGVALSPFWAAGGAIYGAIEGETTKTIGKAEETLNHCLTDLKMQKVMQKQVLSLARERTRYTFVELKQCPPDLLNEQTSYDSLNGKGIDTVLEISVRYCHLQSEKDAIDPPLSLLMTARTRLIRIKDNTVLSSRKFQYESKETRKFTKWAKNDAHPFREELDRCFKRLAERIVVEAFINYN